MNNTILYIARKYLFSSKGNYSFVNINTTVSLLGITFGLAALIIVQSVFNGFQDMTTEALKSEKPLYRLSNINIDQFESLELEKAILYIPEKIVVKESDGFAILKLLTVYNNNSAINSLSIYDSILANKLFIQSAGNSFFTESNTIKEFARLEDIEKVGNFGYTNPFQNIETSYIYSKGIEDNSAILFSSDKEEFSNRQYIQVDIFQELSQSQLLNLNSAGVTIETWEEMNSDLLFILELEKIFSGFVMFMIVCIGLFNLLAAISMLLTVKRIDFFTLGVIGLTKSMKRKVIFAYGITVISIGAILGLCIGIGFVILQNTYNLIPISIEGAMVDYLPINLEPLQIVVSVVGLYLLGLLAISVPASQIGDNIYHWE